MCEVISLCSSTLFLGLDRACLPVCTSSTLDPVLYEASLLWDILCYLLGAALFSLAALQPFLALLLAFARLNHRPAHLQPIQLITRAGCHSPTSGLGTVPTSQCGSCLW